MTSASHCLRHTLWAMVVIGLAGCASRTPPAASAPQWVQVPVLATLPMTDPVAQQACPVPAEPAPPIVPVAPAAHLPVVGAEAPGTVAITTQGFCVSYQFNGQSFSVWLPADPGDQLTLQWPLPSDPAGMSAPVGAVMWPYGYPYPYPYVYGGVFLGGVYYRPRPYVMPAGRWGGTGWSGRGGRHGRR